MKRPAAAGQLALVFAAVAAAVVEAPPAPAPLAPSAPPTPARPVDPLVAAHAAWVARPNARTMGRLLAAARPLLVREALRVVRSPEAAEDLAQDCLLRISEGAAWTYQARGDLGSWLSVLARNAAVSHMRAPRNAREILADEDPDRAPAPEVACDRAGPEALALAGADRDRLERAFAELRADGRRRYARVLRAFYLQGKSIRDISLDEGLPFMEYSERRTNGRANPGKQLLHRARGALRAILERDTE